MSKTTDTLAAYLADTNDAKGVVAFIRENSPKSLASHVSQTKKQWMNLNVINENYAVQYANAMSTVDKSISIAKGD
jgi:hypothetical protein